MPKKNETYETMLARLEEIVSFMDSNEVSLNDSIKKYEEGVTLCNKLYKLLNEAEGKVKLLNENGESNFQTVEE